MLRNGREVFQLEIEEPASELIPTWLHGEPFNRQSQFKPGASN